MKHSCACMVVVVLLFVTHLTAGLALYGQTHGSSPPFTQVKRTDKWIPNTVYDQDTKTPPASLIPFVSSILTKSPVSDPMYKRYGNINANTILPPSISPITSIAGAFLIISGLFSALVGAKNQRAQVFLSTTYITGLGIAVLILHLADPPVSVAIQGAYLVAVLIPAFVIGGLALLFKDVLEGIGSAIGGFCLAMLIMTLRDGGLLQSTVSKTIFIICFTVGIYALSFNRRTKAYVLVCSTSITGATALILGIDCFSLAGLKEFWVYIWGINSGFFLENQATYGITQGMAVEIGGIALFTVLGILSQMRIWNVIMRQKRHYNQAGHLRGHRQEDVESVQTRIEEETQYYEGQEMDHKYSSEQIRSHVMRAVDKTKSTANVDGDTIDELHPVTVEAVQAAHPEPAPSENLDNATIGTGSVEPTTLSTLLPTRTPSTSTTLAGTIKSLDESLPHSGKISMDSRHKQTGRREGGRRSLMLHYRNKSSSQLRQLRASKTFMEIVAAELRRLSHITKTSTGAPAESIDSQQSVSHFQSPARNSQFDHLSIDEAQISQPLIEQESAEQFVSSFLGHPSGSAKVDESQGQILDLKEPELGHDVYDENEVTIDRPPTRHGPISVTSKLSSGETSRVSDKIEPQAVLEHTLRSKCLQPVSTRRPVASEPIANCIEPGKIPRTTTVKSGHNADLTIEKTRLTPNTARLSSGSNLRSSIGTWPQHNNTKHSLQRRLQSSLRNSRSCVLTSPIDEDAVASFTFQPLTHNADIMRRASYPRRSGTDLSAGDSIRQTFRPTSSRGTRQQPFINASSSENPYISNNQQHSRHSFDGPTLSRRKQAYLESIQPEGHAQNHGQSRPKAHSILRKSEQFKIPQHTLYRASMLAEWRRSNPMEPKGLDRTSTTPSPDILRKHSSEPEKSMPVCIDNSHTNNHCNSPITNNRRIVESTIQGPDHKISGSNMHTSIRKAKSVSRRASALTPREINIHKEVLRCVDAGTYPVFENSNMF